MRLMRSMVVIGAALVLSACGGGGGDGGGGTDDGGGATDTITMVDNAFEPADPAVSSGTTVTLVNEGAALHSFTMQDEGIDEDVEAGGESSVDIALDAGSYEFICKYHPEMTGTLTVE